MGGRDVFPTASLSLCHHCLPCQSEDWRGFGLRRGSSADAKILYALLPHCLLNASHILPPRKRAKGREIQAHVCFTLFPTQREIFISSSSEIGRQSQQRREMVGVKERRGACVVCVARHVCVYLPARFSVTKHDGKTSECWKIISILRSRRQY